MTLENKLETLERVDLVSIDCSIWSGRKRLRSDDIQLGKGGKLPPEQVASLGSKRIIDPEDLSVFHTLKKRAERTCEAIGVRFLGGYAIPREKTEAVSQTLAEIAQSFTKEKENFLQRYDEAVEDWVRQYPDFERQLRKELTPLEQVRTRIGFEYAMYRVAGAETAIGNLGDQVGRLGSQLLREIAVEARDLYEQSFAGSAGSDRKASRKALGPIRRMREKLAGLGFLDAAVAPMVKTIDALFAAVSKTGPLEDALYDQALSIVLILSDPDKVRRHATAGLTAAGIPAPKDAEDEFDAEVEDAVERAKTNPAHDTPSESLYF